MKHGTKVLLAVISTLLVPGALGCIFKYGEDLTNAFAKPGTLQFSYAFAGLDWGGICMTGTKQSPINVPSKALSKVPQAERTLLDYKEIVSNGKNVKVINDGHVIQVEWADGAIVSNSSVAVPNKDGVLVNTLDAGAKPYRVPITPLQFHFHGHSEHSLGGAFYPMELHIVSHAIAADLAGCTGPMGCLTVVGVMVALADDDAPNPDLQKIFDIIPMGSKNLTSLPAGQAVDLNALLPRNQSYVTYSGSLTTPPCSEEVLWHVMLHPITMSSQQLKTFLQATSDVKCDHDIPEALGTTGNDTAANKTVTRPPANLVAEEKDSMKETVGNVTIIKRDGADVCIKLGAGQNYRIVQPLAGRTLLGYIDESSEDTSSTSSSSTPAAPAAKTSSSASILLARCSVHFNAAAAALLLLLFCSAVHIV